MKCRDHQNSGAAASSSRAPGRIIHTLPSYRGGGGLELGCWAAGRGGRGFIVLSRFLTFRRSLSRFGSVQSTVMEKPGGGWTILAMAFKSHICRQFILY